ncbi:hypothetical protein IAR55_003410 [Kwoniella newhampshirensis]|uniref:Integral membrane bound transporter domain-containing protein n=1 Tax=Kwoniella newhampshirensis TaxID=1651941 RepID=A0AAW0YZ09_9TREE
MSSSTRSPPTGILLPSPDPVMNASSSSSQAKTPVLSSSKRTTLGEMRSPAQQYRGTRNSPQSYFSLPRPLPSRPSPGDASDGQVGGQSRRRGGNSSTAAGWDTSPSFSNGHGSARSQTGSQAKGSSKLESLESFDNWQGLQELVGDESDEEDAVNRAQGRVTSPGRRSQLPTPSTWSLSSLFDSSATGREDTVRPIDDDNGVHRAVNDLRSISDELSTSPGQLDGVLGGYSPGDQEDDQRTPRCMARPMASPDVMDDMHKHGGSNGLNTPLLGPVRQIKEPPNRSLWPKVWPPSPMTVGILKCALSYLIASLFTFVPALARLLSRQSETDAHGRVTIRPASTAHMIATIVVYFNPAKTLGNMLLSTRYCFVLAVAASVVSLLSMTTIRLFDHFSPSHGDTWDPISEAGDWVVCVLWIGGTMGVLAWSKVWVGNASYNSGCSMAAMIIFTVVIKEGAVPKLVEILSIVLVGVLITNFVCYTVCPASATSRLQSSISKSLESFSTLLDLLTSTFLLEKAVVKENRTTLKEAIISHAAAFRTLKTDLAEAKQERILDGRIRGRKLHLYNAAIASLGRLAQHISGLRSSTRLQESIIRASREGEINLGFGPNEGHSKLSMSVLEVLDEVSEPAVPHHTDVMTSVRLFMKFRDMAGAQMDNLNSHCDEALEAVQALSRHDQNLQVDLPRIRADLAASLKDFSMSSSRAIKRVYAGPRRRRGIYRDEESDESDSGSDGCAESQQFSEVDSPDGNDDVNGDQDSLGGPNEVVFLIYFFLFTFEEFAMEMLFLVDTMQEIVDTADITAWDHIRSVFMRQRGRQEKKSEYLYKQLQKLVPIDPSDLQPPLFPRAKRDSAGAVLVPEERMNSTWGRLKQRFWTVGTRLRQPDMRYAIKTGVGGAILAAPAYTEWGRPIFLQYRGEWALIAYLAAMSQTVGQTNFLSLARVGGTIVGGTVAIVFTRIAHEDNIVLPILGFFFSIPCFYVITQMPDYTAAGRFVLLTYNLSCLYVYNVRDRADDVTVEQIAFQRSTAVIIGVIWAAMISRYWWPFTARRELRLGLSDFCLDLSYLYSRLVTTYSKGVEPRNEENSSDDDGELRPLLPSSVVGHRQLSPSVRQFMAMELHLQSQLGTLRSLLAQTKHEPRLKGPFAYGFYHEVLLSCERMLDRLHSMRCVTTRDEWDNGIRQAFVVPVNKERREMAGNVILYFYTLSAGFRLRTPLPPYLPPAEKARQRLVVAIRSLDVVKRKSVRGGGRHLLFFAYALAMQEVIVELEYLGTMLQDAFGVISQSTVVNFEALFEDGSADELA